MSASEPTRDRRQKGGREAGADDPVVAHYEQQLARHGATAQGMDWKDDASQRLRFAVLCDVADLSGRSVRDVGAGAGHLLDYLQERGIAADYSGSDASRAMVEAARGRHPQVSFDHRAIGEESPPPTYDVVVCSGLFHVKLDRGDGAWRTFVEDGIRRLFALCRVGIAFNLMSDQVDYRAPELYYAHPGDILDFCRREVSRFATVRHDYPLYEFTTYVYRDGFPH